MLTRYDISMVQGSTFVLEVEWKNADDSNKDFTGFKARMQIRRTYADKTPLVDISDETGNITLDSSTSTITITLSANETAAIPVNYMSGSKIPPKSEYVYDLETEAPDGFTVKPIFGKIAISGEVTR